MSAVHAGFQTRRAGSSKADGCRDGFGGDLIPRNVAYEHCWEAPGIYVVRMTAEEYLTYKHSLLR